MNREEQEKYFDYHTELMREIMFKKGDDYANEDRLSNFKLAGSIAGTTAENNCLGHIATKVARLGVLLNSETEPQNEAIEDTIHDLGNYAMLLGMIRADYRKQLVRTATDDLMSEFPMRPPIVLDVKPYMNESFCHPPQNPEVPTHPPDGGAFEN